MFPGWGGMLAAIPEGYLKAKQQQQQMQDQEAQRQLALQAYATNQRQAPLQDSLLKAQIAHMQRPDIAAQQFAQSNAANVYGMGLPMPGATPMPQSPQGAQPQAFQNAQPMFPQGGAAPVSGVPQAQPQSAPQMPAQASHVAPQGQPPAMYQPQSGPSMQPMPTADPIAQQEQQLMGQLQQKAQQIAALPPGPQRNAAAQAIIQQQQMGQAHFQQMRKDAERQLQQAQLNDYRTASLKLRGQGQEAQNTRSEQGNLKDRRDVEVHELSSLMLSPEQNQSAIAAIDDKYRAMGLGGGVTSKGNIPQDTRTKLDAAVEQMHIPGEPIPTDAIGRVISIDGKQYKIVNNNGEVDYEPVK